MTTVYYQMICGCQLERENLVKNKDKNHPYFQNLMCEEHTYSYIVQRFIFCEECGIKRTSEPSNGQPSCRCVPCQKIHIATVKKTGYLNRVVTAKLPTHSPKMNKNMYNKFGDSEKRSSCKFRDICLMDYAWFNEMPCKLCLNYREQIYITDPYACEYG